MVPSPKRPRKPLKNSPASSHRSVRVLPTNSPTPPNISQKQLVTVLTKSRMPCGVRPNAANTPPKNSSTPMMPSTRTLPVPSTRSVNPAVSGLLQNAATTSTIPLRISSSGLSPGVQFAIDAGSWPVVRMEQNTSQNAPRPLRTSKNRLPTEAPIPFDQSMRA